MLIVVEILYVYKNAKVRYQMFHMTYVTYHLKSYDMRFHI